jgi:hypothetical protein
MRRLLVLLGVAVVALSAVRSHAVQPDPMFNVAARDDLHTPVSEEAAIGQTDNTCTVSDPVEDRPPDDPHASSFASPNGTWYANEDRSLWAWWWGKRSVGDYKVLWVRPVGAQLKIIGRRVDGDAPPLSARIPVGYRHTFQSTAIAFPAAGCWQVEGTAGAARLTFVVWIP